MQLREVLARFPGLEKHTLTRWASVGYLRPHRTEKGRKDLIYTEQDIAILEIMFPLYQNGVKPSRAYERALTELRLEKPRTNLGDIQKLAQDLGFGSVESLIEAIFGGKKLSLDALIQRAQSVLTSPQYTRALENFISSLPIERTSDGKYKYRRDKY